VISQSEPGETSAAKSALKMLCANLLQGLHAAAQPLTILRASLSNDQIGEMSLGELRELATTSALEVERACALFSYLQQLVFTESAEPQTSATPIVALVADAADGVNLLFENDGMIVSLMMPDRCQPVLINRERTFQALSSVLLIAQSVSCAHDTVQLAVSSSSSNVVRVVVRNVKSFVGAMSAEASLNMALAEANIRSQQGSLSWSLQPFSVQIELPGVSSAP
jgi:hypothetical protein